MADGSVYFGGNDGRLYALNAANGGQLWSSDTGYGPPTDVAAAGQVIYFGGNNNRLYALNA
jgi:eukaryotic-like serine/threonine-protein kinase